MVQRLGDVAFKRLVRSWINESDIYKLTQDNRTFMLYIDGESNPDNFKFSINGLVHTTPYSIINETETIQKDEGRHASYTVAIRTSSAINYPPLPDGAGKHTIVTTTPMLNIQQQTPKTVC